MARGAYGASSSCCFVPRYPLNLLCVSFWLVDFSVQHKKQFFFLQQFNFFFYPLKSPDETNDWTSHKLMNVTQAASTLQLAESFFGTNRRINEEKVTGCPSGTQCVFMCVTELAFEKPDTLTNVDCVLTLIFTFCHVFFIPHLFNYCEIVFLICSNSKFRFWSCVLRWPYFIVMKSHETLNFELIV